MNQIRAVSFDVDGTLYERPVMAAALRRVAFAAALRRPLRVARDLRRLAGLRASMEAVRRAGGDLRGLRLSSSRAELAALEAEYYLPAIAAAGPRSGVVEAVAELRAAGLTVVAWSDHPCRDKLAALGFGEAFARVYVGEELGWLKPAREPFLRIAGDLGVAPRELLHVGDRADTDGAGAQAAGCRGVILSPGPAPAASALLARASGPA